MKICVIFRRTSRQKNKISIEHDVLCRHGSGRGGLWLHVGLAFGTGCGRCAYRTWSLLRADRVRVSECV